MIRILMPSIVDPAVQYGGAWTMTRGLLRLLREGPLKADVEVVATRHRLRARHLARQCMAVGRSVFTGLPAKIEFSREWRISAEVRRLLREHRFDLVMLNGTDLLWLLPHLPDGMPRMLVAHNIEHQLFAAQMAANSTLPGLAADALRKDCERLRRYETGGLRALRNAIFLSPDDEASAKALSSELRTLTLPPIFDGPPARRRVPAPDDDILNLGMLANFEWWPSRQGLDWFAREVFPQLSAGIRLHLFGRGSVEAVPADVRVVAHGRADSLDEVWAACDVMICPVLSGGGVSIKMAEAVYRGMPLIGTRFAARGLPLVPHPSIVLLDDAADWVRCLNDNGFGLARQIVPTELSARFSIEAYAKAVSDFLLEAIGAGHRPNSPR